MTHADNLGSSMKAFWDEHHTLDPWCARLLPNRQRSFESLFVVHCHFILIAESEYRLSEFAVNIRFPCVLLTGIL